ncbi:hypothetical protein PS858_04138 [Pseudomonas fluorescens]|uniref:hypothetical protein n=1 Tax=Pseudomonas fluorescens TaxID=294 RepID=UPI00123FA63B|nr:hypothetical protein [Pseudomonas fluorescens]VVP27462.1 hypothetical protein PS858_04138 [Pseudomonas fluorescens]
MSWEKLDWKFFVTLIATIAGVVIPVYLWQADFSSRSIGLRLLSTSALQPAANIQDLQIFLNGKKIESPYLSSFELINTGSKPVLSADFESPIEILPTGGAKLVSAQVTTTVPDNIPVKISFDDQRIAIAPILLNPKDTVSFSVITSGEQPFFEPRARIAGINSITLEDFPSKKDEYQTASLNLFLAFALLVPYLIFLVSAVSGEGLPLSRPIAFFISTVCYIGAGKALRDAYILIEPWPFSIGIFIAIAIVGAVLSLFVVRKTAKMALMIRRHKAIKHSEPFASPPWE